MTMKNLIANVATVVLLTGAMLSTPAMAQSANGFSALQGIEAQALSSQEMDAISGELNAYDISAALQDAATNLAQFPRLAAAITKLAAYYLTNADTINMTFEKYGILTPCKTCAP